MSPEQFWAELCREEERRKAEKLTFRKFREQVQQEVRQIIRAKDLNRVEQQSDSEGGTS